MKAALTADILLDAAEEVHSRHPGWSFMCKTLALGAEHSTEGGETTLPYETAFDRRKAFKATLAMHDVSGNGGLAFVPADWEHGRQEDDLVLGRVCQWNVRHHFPTPPAVLGIYGTAAAHNAGQETRIWFLLLLAESGLFCKR